MDREPWIPAMGLAFRAFDFGACFVWAVSGALLAARRGYDFTGIFAVALLSSTGGGLLRDGFFLQSGPPALARTPAYIAIAAVAALFVLVWGARFDRRPLFAHVVTLTDALGLGAFAVVGMHLALSANLSLPAVVLVGVVNAVGGSLLRSILLHQVPEVFRPGEWTALAALVGCFVYVGLLSVARLDDRWAAIITVVLVAAVRMASVHYRLVTAPARGFQTPDP